MTVTISHTHAGGTLVYGTSKGDGSAAVLKAEGFRWFPSIKLWGVPQSRDRLAKRWKIDAAAQALTRYGFQVTVEVDDTPRDVAEVKADRVERLDARAEALAAKAEKTMASALAHERVASEIADRRPFGQPILVGHYSERGARADQRRIERNMDKFCEEYGQAKHYERAARVTGSQEAYRERPAVIVRRVEKTEADLRKTTRAAQHWGIDTAYGEQCQARLVFLQNQLEADREALQAAKDAGYRLFTKSDVHPGDLVATGRFGGVPDLHEVVRVSAKSVSVKTGYSWTDLVSYDRITGVECPHKEAS